MGLVTNLLNRLLWKLSSVSLKKKILYSLLLVLLLTFSIHYLMSPSFIPFQDISQILLPCSSLFLTYNNSNSQVCDHLYEKQLSNERIELVINKTEPLARYRGVGMRTGGTWAPSDCVSKYRVNLVIPYRNRLEHLNLFLLYFHQYLQLQQINYRIFVVEQNEENMFNRGKLFNIGFSEAEKHDPSDCYIFHDVDLIPLSLNNMYACTNTPRHMSSAVDTFNFELPYRTIFGGAVSFTRAQFELVNGYSNSFYGWGGEDDDLFNRVRKAGLDVVRFEPQIARYRMLKHVKESPNPDRFSTMKKSLKFSKIDGLTNLNYTLLDYKLNPLYTLIKVQL